MQILDQPPCLLARGIALVLALIVHGLDQPKKQQTEQPRRSPPILCANAVKQAILKALRSEAFKIASPAPLTQSIRD